MINGLKVVLRQVEDLKDEGKYKEAIAILEPFDNHDYNEDLLYSLVLYRLGVYHELLKDYKTTCDYFARSAEAAGALDEADYDNETGGV